MWGEQVTIQFQNWVSTGAFRIFSFNVGIRQRQFLRIVFTIKYNTQKSLYTFLERQNNVYYSIAAKKSIEVFYDLDQYPQENRFCLIPMLTSGS